MNLSTMPAIETAQEILNSILAYGRARYTSIQCLLPSGNGCVWLPINKDWGLKIFHRLDWGYSGYRGAVLNAAHAYNIGIGPYIHVQEHTIFLDSVARPAFFMQRVDTINEDEFYSFPMSECVRHWQSKGFTDILPENVGKIDGKYTLLDASHRRQAW